ncbi:MAG: hypothetical protein NXI24_04110 [bacterium]|nr:hypothetical protein [bacterium]
MAEGLSFRLCLHEFPGTGEAPHLDLFVRATWRVSRLDTFEISSDFLPELEGRPGESAPESEEAVQTLSPPGPLFRLRILEAGSSAAGGPADSNRVDSGDSRVWRAERKANHRLRYWSHSGPIEPAEPGGPERGRIREVGRGFLLGTLPPQSESGFDFQLEVRR